MPSGVYLRKFVPKEIRFCKCGCGFSKRVKVTDVWQYKSGHNHKGKCGRKRGIRIIRKCEFCDETWECTPKNGKRFCNTSCANKWLMQHGKVTMNGKKHSKETIEKMRNTKIKMHEEGISYNQKTRDKIKLKRALQIFTVESRIKQGKSMKEFWEENYDSPIILARNEKIRKSMSGKTLAERLGIEVAKESIRKSSETRKSKKHKHSQKTKRLMRLAAIRRIERNNGICKPNYNPKACELFKSLDEKENTNGRYATNGGEFYIKELGYFLDYINFFTKKIREYDESIHYNIDGTLKQKDIQRQKEIMELFPDFKFERIRE